MAGSRFLCRARIEATGADGGQWKWQKSRERREVSIKKKVQVTLKSIQMQSTKPTLAQIDLIRKLVRAVTLENAHAEYEKALLQFTSKEEFQAALRFVELEIQQHLMLVEHWHHLTTM